MKLYYYKCTSPKEYYSTYSASPWRNLWGEGGCKPDFLLSCPRPLLRGLALSGLRESSLPDLGFITLCRSGSTALSQNPLPQEGSTWGLDVSLILLIRILVQGGWGQHGPFLIKLLSRRSEISRSCPQASTLASARDARAAAFDIPRSNWTALQKHMQD